MATKKTTRSGTPWTEEQVTASSGTIQLKLRVTPTAKRELKRRAKVSGQSLSEAFEALLQVR